MVSNGLRFEINIVESVTPRDHDYVRLKIKKLHDEVKELEEEKNYWEELPLEVIHVVLKWCRLSDILNMSATCRTLYLATNSCNMKWKTLCCHDFDVFLQSKGKFNSYFDIYRLLYSSRILLGSFIYGRYYSKRKLGLMPSWLLVWALLSRNPPIMKFGKHRIKKRINGRYLRRLHNISYGQVKRLFNENFFEFLNFRPKSSLLSTIYFSWKAIRYVEIKKFGSQEKYEQYLLDRCYRARGFIERNYERVQGTDPLRSI